MPAFSITDRIGAPLLRLALLLALTGCAIAAAAGTARAAGPLVGFNEYNDPSNYAYQQQLNMPVRRLLMGWNTVQPTPETWDWSASDRVYSDLVAHGLRPLIDVQSAPCWANATLPCSDAGHGALPPDPAHYGDWARFIAALAARYPAAVAIEIWNEPNLTYEWLPYPDPAAYAAVVAAAHTAVKQVSSSIPVISGGLFVSSQSGRDGIGDAQFLSGMYAAGIKGHFDGIGIHPYPVAGGWDGTPVRLDITTTERTLDALRYVRALYGDSSTPLWITEMGVSTQSLFGSAPAVSSPTQAFDLLSLISRVSADADVRTVLIHRLIDQPLDGADLAAGVDGYGVFAPDGTPKLAACQLSLLFHGTLTCPGVALMTGALYTAPTATRPAPVVTPAPPRVPKVIAKPPGKKKAKAARARPARRRAKAARHKPAAKRRRVKTRRR